MRSRLAADARLVLMARPTPKTGNTSITETPDLQLADPAMGVRAFSVYRRTA